MKCECCIIFQKAGNVAIANDAYLNILSRSGMFVPSKSLADFVWSNFPVLDFVEADIVALSLPVKTSTAYVLRY